MEYKAMSTNLQAIKQRFGIVGASPLLDRALDTAVRVAATDLSVLITGESGVGKEVFSKIIHALSSRKHNSFIAINCGAIPEGTINSELFGHEKGAFTGATNDRKGYFETYNSGTIFLDEIGEMPLDTQSFLLRVLESGEFIRVGASKVLKTDVRIIAATNVDLKEKINKGKFREDLYFRLNTVPIFVPSLRERPEDIYMLFRRFALDFADKYRSQPIQLEEEAQLLLRHYNWPGNIRELKNVAEQLSVLSENRIIAAQELLHLLPQIKQRNLPIPVGQANGNNFQEREIFYKLLLDMKTDLNDLKSLVFGLIQNNNLQVPEKQNIIGLQKPSNYHPQTEDLEDREAMTTFFPYKHPDPPIESEKPIILANEQKSNAFSRIEEIDDNLSLEDNEKELIRKALKKHQNRRKEAAHELGISERTLYRKIKQYGLG